MKIAIRLLLAVLLVLPYSSNLPANDIVPEPGGFSYQQVVNSVDLPWDLLSQSKPGQSSPVFNHWNGTGDEVREAACCKRCSTGKPCGNSCISRSKTCRVGPGCAC